MKTTRERHSSEFKTNVADAILNCSQLVTNVLPRRWSPRTGVAGTTTETLHLAPRRFEHHIDNGGARRIPASGTKGSRQAGTVEGANSKFALLDVQRTGAIDQTDTRRKP